jgi:hypothetical protein
MRDVSANVFSDSFDIGYLRDHARSSVVQARMIWAGPDVFGVLNEKPLLEHRK